MDEPISDFQKTVYCTRLLLRVALGVRYLPIAYGLFRPLFRHLAAVGLVHQSNHRAKKRKHTRVSHETATGYGNPVSLGRDRLVPVVVGCRYIAWYLNSPS